MGISGLSLQAYSLSALQVLILSVILNPEPCLKRYNSISRTHIALFLDRPIEEVHAAMNEKLLDAIFDATTYNLRMQKAQIDAALLASASQPNGYGFSDRKLYYSLIAAVHPSEKPTDGNVSREAKLQALLEFAEKHNIKGMKGTLNGRNAGSKRNGNAGSGRTGEEDGQTQGTGVSSGANTPG
jgi:hypothetical protein